MAELIEPIVERIALAIEARLLTVQIANGYEVDIAGVVRPSQLGLDKISPRNLLAVMMQLDPRVDDSKQDGVTLNPDGRGLIHWIQPWAIALFIQTSEKADPVVSADTLINRFKAAVDKALLQDSGWGAKPTEPLAYATHLIAGEYFEVGAGGYLGVTDLLEVRYRTFENDPYSQPGL